MQIANGIAEGMVAMVLMLPCTQVVLPLLSSTRRHHERRGREFGTFRQGVMLCCLGEVYEYEGWSATSVKTITSEGKRVWVVMLDYVNMKWMDKSFVRVSMDENETCYDRGNSLQSQYFLFTLAVK